MKPPPAATVHVTALKSITVDQLVSRSRFTAVMSPSLLGSLAQYAGGLARAGDPTVEKVEVDSFVLRCSAGTIDCVAHQLQGNSNVSIFPGTFDEYFPGDHVEMGDVTWDG